MTDRSPHLERLVRAGNFNDLAEYALHLEHQIARATTALIESRPVR